MTENEKLLDVIKILVDEVREELGTTVAPDQVLAGVLNRGLLKLGTAVKMLATDLLAEKEKTPEPQDAVPDKKLRVGDQITSSAQLDALPNRAIVLDSCKDAWQKIDERWNCTDAEGGHERGSSHLLTWAPLTVAWLPKEKSTT